MKKILVIGTGSIAEKHIKNLLKLNYKVSVYSESKNKINKIKDINYLENLSNLSIFEFVILANSTDKHLKYLKILIKNKKNIYCEKPIFFRNFDILKMRKDIIKNKILVFIGYQLMVHDKIRYLQKQLKKEKINSFVFEVGHDFRKWRKKNSFKNNYFMDDRKGGGVIFELIHEINLIQNISGKIKYIKTLRKKIISKNITDLSISIIKTKNGSAGVLYQDMFSPYFFRNYKIITDNKIYELDMVNSKLKINNKVKMFNKKKKSHQVLLRDNLILFSKMIKTKSLASFDNSVSDMKIALKMYQN